MTGSANVHSNSDNEWGMPVVVAAPIADKGSEPSQEAKVAKFLETAKTLQRLELFSNKAAHSRTYFHGVGHRDEVLMPESQ